MVSKRLEKSTALMLLHGMGELGYSALVISVGTTRRNEDSTYPKTCVTLILRNA